MGETGDVLATIALLVAIWIGIGVQRTIRWRKTLSNVDLDGVRTWLERLCDIRDPEAYLIFEEMMPSKRFVQFRRDAGHTVDAVTCHFPNAPWSAPYLPVLTRVLEAHHFVFSETPTHRDEPVVAFITIESLDAPAAARLVDVIFREVFRSPSVNVRVWGYRTSRIDR